MKTPDPVAIEHSSHLLPRAALLKVPRQERSVDMVHTILDAGTEVLQAEGMTAFTTNRVAKLAGVSVGSLYQYFANKDALLLGVIERGVMNADAEVRKHLLGLELATAEATLAALFQGMIDLLQPRRALLQEVLTTSPLLSESGFLALVEGRFLDLLRQVAHRHGITEYEPVQIYVATNATCFLLLKWLADPSPYLGHDRFVATTAKLVVDTLGRTNDLRSL
ncbi:MAG: helix-turn-helix domain-containing protein [Myxococcota bacterium]